MSSPLWFKYLRIFQSPEPITLTADALNKQLEPMRFKPCPKSQPTTAGFVPPCDTDKDKLVYEAQGNLLIRLRIEERVLPASVVKEELDEKVANIEASSGRKVYKDEKERLKEDIYGRLLSQSFTRSSYINALIDCKHQRLLVDAASSQKCAKILHKFNRCTGLALHAAAHRPVPTQLTNWLEHNSTPDSLSIGHSALLTEMGESNGHVRLKQQDLYHETIQTFIKRGHQATQLSLHWREHLQFTLKEDFSFSAIRFLDAVKSLEEDGLGETPDARFASQFLILSETLQAFVNDLLSIFSDTSETEATAEN